MLQQTRQRFQGVGSVLLPRTLPVTARVYPAYRLHLFRLQRQRAIPAATEYPAPQLALGRVEEKSEVFGQRHTGYPQLFGQSACACTMSDCELLIWSNRHNGFGPKAWVSEASLYGSETHAVG